MALATRASEQFALRFPAGMREQIREVADKHGRSMNSEIVIALSAHLAAATGGKFGDPTPAAASSNNAALAGGASINQG
ncbi:Arc family DNA-binding protein [Neorhizobium sp. CSC1952]|uniref:Arc family DNA-binding protein n=1 Tax=Neorhizobium sp. CSC1952 TaxID=2978974 RepID=UPI0025A51FB4|nr:Arc family DNA-binding protein [Rhizobium sp. CSC1952]WJR66943.1 Arc family DNA-binding protein [Rhizobium sp. CSC1952]